MNTLRSVVVGTVPLSSTGAALAQNPSMMGGGAWGGWMGGYGGGWGTILVAVAVVVLVAWIVQRNGK